MSNLKLKEAQFVGLDVLKYHFFKKQSERTKLFEVMYRRSFLGN